MSAAVLLDPYSSLEISAQGDAKTMGSNNALICQDTPQLRGHDYPRWHHSPALSVSPELDHRRIRRKPSIQNLTGRSALSAFSRTPSSIPPLSNHNSATHDSHLQQPSTPRPRAYTASPSLSSTITTLQSTPTHTPILRGGSFDERRREFARSELEGPIGTKRKYPSVKHARRFPRRQTGRQGSEESGIYKVYAAVFDVSGEQSGLREEPSKADEHYPRAQAAPNSKKNQAVRFTGVETRRSDSANSTLNSGQSLHRREQTATSTYSLSKFEFPAPPNKDNWAGTLDHLPRSPSATVLYRGASFDLLNPHASLLLGTHSIETPAEIDCLLDDYFEEHEDLIVMASNPDTGEVMQQSLRSVSESKQTNTLYDDADTARRNILRIPTPVALPIETASIKPPAAAVTMPSFMQEAASGVHAPLKRPNTNSMRTGLSNLGRTLGMTRGNENPDPTKKVDDNTQRRDSAKEEEQLTGEDDARGSNPFDLEFSEHRSNAELMGIDGMLHGERGAVLESAVDPYGQRTALTVEDDSNTHAMSDIEPDIGSFIDGYDYTRDTAPSVEQGHSRDFEDPSLSAASVERGLNAGDKAEDTGSGWYTPVPAGEQFRSPYYGYDMFDDPDTMQPRPLDSRRNIFINQGPRTALSGDSVVHTSDQTYGDTRDLLMLSNPSASDGTRHLRVFQDSTVRDTSPILFRHEYDYEEEENIPPLEPNQEGYERSLGGEWTDPDRLAPYPHVRADRVLAEIDPYELMDNRSVIDSIEPYARMRTGSVIASPSFVVVERGSLPGPLRVSYNGSGWETERSESPGLTETIDATTNGSRYDTSGPSNEGSAVSRVRPDPFRVHLTHDGIPDLNNPRPEISPQRERSKRKRWEDDGHMRLNDARVSDYSSGGADDEIQRTSPILFGHRRRKTAQAEYVPTQYDSGFDPGPIDFNSEPIGDAKRALELISNKAQRDCVGVHRLCSPGNKSPLRLHEIQEVEFIRSRHPNAMKEAVARFSHQQACQVSSLSTDLSPLPNGAQASSPGVAPASSPQPAVLQKPRKLNPFGRKAYIPSNSFQKAAALGRHEAAHGSFSSRRGLLSQQAPARGGLAYSDSQGTFRTQRDRNSAELQSPPGEWDPFQSSPTARVLDRRHPAFSAGGTARLPSNLRSASGVVGRQGRPAVEEQYEMRALRMGLDSGPGRLTDQELQRREPEWRDNPVERGLPYTNARLVPHTLHHEQKGISIKYLALARFIPFGPLAFGLGWLDRIVVKKTNGRITSMGRAQKRQALMVYFPLHLLGITIIGVVAGILIGLLN